MLGHAGPLQLNTPKKYKSGIKIPGFRQNFQNTKKN
jgi:hypothetical protein